MNYNFEWDPARARSNYRKHKIGFDRAAEVFLDPWMLTIFDEAHNGEDERWITLGVDRNGVLLVLVHTFAEVDSDHCLIRIISARRATRKEAKQYSSR